MAFKKRPFESGWTYGVSPNPNNWHQTAEALAKMRSKGPSLNDILQQLTENMKEGRRDDDSSSD